MLEDAETQAEVWCDIDLEAIEDYECFRDETTEWADRVDWLLVQDVMRSIVAQLAERDQLDDLLSHVSAAASAMPEPDSSGLASLWSEPIFASPAQISNGGHRITAMRKQGIRWALGQGYAETVDPLHAYGPAR